MKIDGYVKPDREIALNQGVTFKYETKYGVLTIVSKMAGKDNVRFRLAMDQYNSWQARRKAINNSADDVEADKKLLGVVYDNLVISWSTTIKTDGKEIAPTRENFIGLMAEQAMVPVFGVFMADAADTENFRPLSEEEALGNSQPASGGNSSGGSTSSS